MSPGGKEGRGRGERKGGGGGGGGGERGGCGREGGEEGMEGGRVNPFFIPTCVTRGEGGGGEEIGGKEGKKERMFIDRLFSLAVYQPHSGLSGKLEPTAAM